MLCHPSLKVPLSSCFTYTGRYLCLEGTTYLQAPSCIARMLSLPGPDQLKLTELLLYAICLCGLCNCISCGLGAISCWCQLYSVHLRVTDHILILSNSPPFSSPPYPTTGKMKYWNTGAKWLAEATEAGITIHTSKTYLLKTLPFLIILSLECIHWKVQSIKLPLCCLPVLPCVPVWRTFAAASLPLYSSFQWGNTGIFVCFGLLS